MQLKNQLNRKWLEYKVTKMYTWPRSLYAAHSYRWTKILTVQLFLKEIDTVSNNVF